MLWQVSSDSYALCRFRNAHTTRAAVQTQQFGPTGCELKGSTKSKKGTIHDTTLLYNSRTSCASTNQQQEKRGRRPRPPVGAGTASLAGAPYMHAAVVRCGRKHAVDARIPADSIYCAGVTLQLRQQLPAATVPHVHLQGGAFLPQDHCDELKKHAAASGP